MAFHDQNSCDISVASAPQLSQSLCSLFCAITGNQQNCSVFMSAPLMLTDLPVEAIERLGCFLGLRDRCEALIGYPSASYQSISTLGKLPTA